MDDWELLQAYAKDRSETAFAELVRRHLDWVYSAALRQVGDRHLAEDVVQGVFVLLARRGVDLRPGTLLGGWLFRTMRFVAGHVVRTELRRKAREATACTMTEDVTSPDAGDVTWQQLAPHLDQAVSALSEFDRSAILLRFYERLPLRQVGEKLGVSEEAAKKRVSRALEKLRTVLERRSGVKLGGTTLAALLAEKTVQSASVALAGAVTRVSLASSASVGVVLPRLAGEVLRAWRWTKIKFAVGLTGASLALFFVAVGVRDLVVRHPATPTASHGAAGADTAAAAVPNPDELALIPANANDPAQPPRKSGAITGWVIDEQGRSLPGAMVWGGHASAPIATDITDQAGQFALPKVDGPTFVTVMLDGYAADQHEVDPANLTAPLVFRLNRARALRVRLVDESGQGVEGVKWYLARWWGRSGTLGQYLPHQSDGDGRLQWLGPPRGELQLEFIKAGYRYSRTNKFSADDEEHPIVLHPSATVTGRVADAETDMPVASFKVTLGHAQPWVPDDPMPMWDYSSHAGSNGSYKALIEEEQRPYLRIEADGYETVETEIQLTNGLEVIRDFALRRVSVTNSIRGVVVGADGSPAAGVEVALCTAQAGVMLNGTAFEPEAFGNLNREQKHDYRRKTDAHGSFSFDPKPGAHTVVAVGPEGLGRMRCFDSSKPLEIRLQPWGRVEGIVRTRDGQWADRTVRWQKPGNLTSWMTLFYNAKGFAAQSDSSGRFTLEHVPPGDGRVAIDNGTGIAPTLSVMTTVNPGETVQVEVGGVGRMITGKLLAPANVEIRSWSHQVTVARLKHEWARYPLPETLTGNAVERWKLEYEESEAGRAWFLDSREYDFKVGTDGSFSIPEVLPGRYWLSVSVVQGPLGSGLIQTDRWLGGGPQIAWGGMKVVVKDAAEGGEAPLDLGEIVLNATR